MQKDMFSFMLVFSLDFMKGWSLMQFEPLQYFTLFLLCLNVLYMCLLIPFLNPLIPLLSRVFFTAS